MSKAELIHMGEPDILYIKPVFPCLVFSLDRPGTSRFLSRCDIFLVEDDSFFSSFLLPIITLSLVSISRTGQSLVNPSLYKALFRATLQFA